MTKRVLAYHSLEHMGIIAFGLGIGGPVALAGALLHALNHALTKALMFLTFGNVRREYARKQGLSEVEGWRAAAEAGGGVAAIGPCETYLSVNSAGGATPRRVPVSTTSPRVPAPSLRAGGLRPSAAPASGGAPDFAL